MEDLIKALQIFLKYENKMYPTYCEHDILYVDIDPSIVSDEDKETLDGLFGGTCAQPSLLNALRTNRCTESMFNQLLL